MTKPIPVDLEVTNGGLYLTLGDTEVDLSDPQLRTTSNEDLDAQARHIEAVEDALVRLVAAIPAAIADLQAARALIGVKCEDCDGAGYNEDWRGNEHECPACGGTGRLVGVIA